LLIGLLFANRLNAQLPPFKVALKGDRIPDGLRLTNRAGALFTIDSLAADSQYIAAYYQNLGWLDCQVNHTISESRGYMELTYKILRGNRYLLLLKPAINNPADSADASVMAVIGSYNNQPAAANNIESMVGDILQIYADRGYPYCEINPGDFLKREGSILQGEVNIVPGPKVMIRRIEYPGLKNLDRSFLDKYIGLRLPIPYSSVALKASAWRLGHARFLRESGDYELRYLDTPENGVIYFPIDEISPVVLDGALGYSSKDKSLYGLANGTISNILGKGRQFGFNWQKKDKASQKLRLTYNEPLLFGQPFRLDLAAYQEDRDSLYIESGGQLGFAYTSSSDLEYGLAFGASQISPEPYGRNILPGKNRRWMTIDFTADTRDYPGNPKSGDYLQLEANFTSETTRRDSLFAGVSNNFRTAIIDYRRSIAVAKSQSIYTRLFGRGDFSPNSSIDRQFPIGGSGNLRGYRQDIFYVIRAAIITAEYRLLTGKDGRAYIFGDMALLQKGLGSNKTDQKAGFGVGIAAPVRTGLAIIELAVPSDEGFSSIKLHFGIKAGF
jgi:outer membrane protein assembly factor BamA